MGDNGGTNFVSAAGERLTPAQARAFKQKQQAYAKAGKPSPKLDAGGGIDGIADDGDMDKFGEPDSDMDDLVQRDPDALNNYDKFVRGDKPQADNSYDGMPFGKAFRAARNSGADVFTWRGKKYTTELADPASQELDPMHNPGEATDETLHTARTGRDGDAPAASNGNQFQPTGGLLGGASLEDALLAALGLGGAAGGAYAGVKGGQAIKQAGPAREEAAQLGKSSKANVEAMSGDERRAMKLLSTGDRGAAMDIAKKMRNVGMVEEADRIEKMAGRATGSGMIGRGAVKIDDLLTRLMKGAM